MECLESTPEQVFGVTPKQGHSGAGVWSHSGSKCLEQVFGVTPEQVFIATLEQVSHSGAGVWSHSGAGVWTPEQVFGVTLEQVLVVTP